MTQTDLAPENLEFLQAAIACGKYKDEKEVINEAIWLLKRRDEFKQSIDAACDELDAGLGVPAEEVFRHLEERISQIERESSSGENGCAR